MARMNSFVGIGRLTRDVDARVSKSGTSVCKTGIAIDRIQRGGKDRNSDEQTVDFFDLVCFGHTADFVAKYLGKGNLVAVRGEVHIDQWVDRDGNRRQSPIIQAEEIQSLQSKPNDGDAQSNGAKRGASENPFSDEANGEEEDPFGD